MASNDPFRSARLIYRAVEETDEDFIYSIQIDPIAYRNANDNLSAPQGRDSANRYLKVLREEMLLSVIICLPAPEASPAIPDPKPIPLGVIHLEAPKDAKRAHHRHTEIGVDILKPYQGQGYGSEAIRWALRWAFRTAGMHRVGIGAWEYNEGAVRLYQRLGFKLEGRLREYVFHEGRFWDDVHFGMLKREWEEMQRQNAG